MLPMDGIANGVKCEDLEKIFVNDDSKFFFWSELSYFFRRRKS